MYEHGAIPVNEWGFRISKWVKERLPAGLRLRLAELRGRIPRPEIGLAELHEWGKERQLPAADPADADLTIYPSLDRRERERLSTSELLPEDRVIHEAFARPPAVPRTSVVVVTYGNLALTRLCLRSVARHTQGCELLVVDNASPDPTPQWLQALYDRGAAGLRLFLNRENLGFARANNQALSAARGEYLILLNNDTIVPPDWLAPLEARLRLPEVGLAGPCTNHVANEAQVGVPYRALRDMQLYAAWRRQRFAGRVREPGMLAMFCAAMRRDVYETVGELDERFGLGMFEDDDYSRRVRARGLRLELVLDAFVHHFQMAAFGRLKTTGEYRALYERNLRLYREKWAQAGVEPAQGASSEMK